MTCGLEPERRPRARASAWHPAAARRLPRRWGPVAGLASGVALVLVLVIVGPGLFNGAPPRRARLPWPPPGAVASAAGAAGRHPDRRGLAGQLGGDQGTAGPVPGDGQRDQRLPDRRRAGLPADRRRVEGPGQPAHRAQLGNPLADQRGEAIVGAPSVDQAGTTLYVLDVKPAPAGSPSASPAGPTAVPASSQPTAKPTPTASQTAVPSQSAGASPSAQPTASPSPSGPGASAGPSATPTPLASTRPSSPASSSISPPPSGSPSPSAAATLAIVSNVTLVGDEAAYSPDGQWFAFSARPAGITIGPDIYVWRPGWPAARPITSDHGTVFSGWIDGQILASRAIPEASAGTASPRREHQPRRLGRTSASPGPGASPQRRASAAPSALRSARPWPRQPRS